jgi:hypothetical protein
MPAPRPIHPDFLQLLELKDKALVALFKDLRSYILDIYPDSIELLYHTHALTAVFCVSEKLADAFCMLPIYSNHVNFGFNKGTLLTDPHQLLTGTGKLIRHIPVSAPADYRNKKVKTLLQAAIDLAIADREKLPTTVGKTISKISIGK